MQKMIAAEELSDLVPGKILAKSDDLGWNDLAFRSYSYTGQFTDVPGFHDYVLVSFLNGVTPIRRRCEGKWTEATCGPGSVSLLTSGQAAQWHWTEDISVSHLYLSAKLVSDVAREVTGKTIDAITLADVLSTHDPIATAAIQAVECEVRAVGFGGDLYVDALARQLVIHLLRHYASIKFRQREKSGCLSVSQMRDLTEFIDSELEDTLDLPTLASIVGMAPCTFSRYFKRTVGTAPYAYVMDQRLNRAHKMVIETNSPLKVIAARCGFSDQSHLTRLFGKKYGVPPSVFRRDLH